MKHNRPDEALADCKVCGKKGYRDRKAARHARKRLHPNERMRAYQCHGETGLWHIGHNRVADDALNGTICATKYEPPPVSAISQMHQMMKRDNDA